MYRSFHVLFLGVTLLLLSFGSHSAWARRNGDDLESWEKMRGDVIYGNLEWSVGPNKQYSSDYYIAPGGEVRFFVTGAIPDVGTYPEDKRELAFQAMENLFAINEAAGGSKYDIMRNPVRSNDEATLANDPNNALVIRNALALKTHEAYDLFAADGVTVNWPKFPSDLKRRPPGRSYVIMRNDEGIVMDVTSNIGSNALYQHDASTGETAIRFNNLPFNWTELSAQEQDALENSGMCVDCAGKRVCYHYPSPTSLSYTPNVTVCDGRPGNFGSRQCRHKAIRSCERSFAPMDQTEPRQRNNQSLVVGGKLRWKGQRYNCTDVINYNGGGALWCRISSDSDIVQAFEIAEAHHDNGARSLGFTPEDDILIDVFLTNVSTQYGLFRAWAARRFHASKYPALVPNAGRLVGNDKIELTGEHSTGIKIRTSQQLFGPRRVTPASIEGWNTVRVGSEAVGTAHSGHVCSGRVCSLPSDPVFRVRQAFENAFADLRTIGHNNPIKSVAHITAFVSEANYAALKQLVIERINTYWPDARTRPVATVEPHLVIWPYVSNINGYTIEGPNDVIINVRSIDVNAPFPRF